MHKPTPSASAQSEKADAFSFWEDLPRMPFLLNELPSHTPWPEILLGLKSFAPRQRTRETVLREYDCEKWGESLKWLQGRANITRDDISQLRGEPNQLIPISVGQDLFLAKRADAFEAYERWLINKLQQYTGDALVELGSGLGEKLLGAMQALKPRAAYGGEFTASGVACGQLLAKVWGLQATFSHFDFTNPATLEAIPTGAVVYTAHAIEQIPELNRSFVEALLRRAPRVVLHFEPCHAAHRSGNLLSLLRERYVQINDYNRNLLDLLRAFEANGNLQILSYQPDVFGLNPLNPTSLVVWTPKPL